MGLFCSRTSTRVLQTCSRLFHLNSSNFDEFIMAEAFPEIKSTHSLVAKHVTPEKWEKLCEHKTATSGFTLKQAIACAVEYDDQHCGIYAGDADSYKDFADVFHPLILEYHGLSEDFSHTSDMDFNKLKGNINADAPVKSTRIRVGRSIAGFGLSPGITKEQRLEMETLMKSAFAKLEGDLAGAYFPLQGMEESVRQQLVDDHFLFVSGDKNLITAGMERDWPEGLESFTMLRKLSLFGLMKKINSELSQCKKVEMSRVSFHDWPEVSRLWVIQ